MKKYFLIVLCIAFGMQLQAQEKTSKKEKATFTVTGNCEMCKKRIEKAALSVKGVKMANWDIPTNSIEVLYNAQKVKLLTLHKQIAQAGHDTELVEAPDEVYAELPVCCLYERKKN